MSIGFRFTAISKFESKGTEVETDLRPLFYDDRAEYGTRLKQGKTVGDFDECGGKFRLGNTTREYVPEIPEGLQRYFTGLLQMLFNPVSHRVDLPHRSKNCDALGCTISFTVVPSFLYYSSITSGCCNGIVCSSPHELVAMAYLNKLEVLECKLCSDEQLKYGFYLIFHAGRFSVHRVMLAMLCLFAFGCQPKSSREDSPSAAMDSKVETHAEDSQPAGMSSGSSGENASSPASIALKLVAGELDSKLAPRYSPPGKPLKLEAFETPAELGVDGLVSEVVLGAPVDKQTPVKLLVTRASADSVYTNLYVDSDGNGKFDEPAIAATTSESRGMTWSNFNTTMKAKYLGEETVVEDYPVVFWLTVAAVSDRPDVLRMSRRGYKMGNVSVGNDRVSVVLSDSNNDAIFGEGDWWELRESELPTKSDSMRRVGEFAWLGESAYKLELDNAFGGNVRLVPFDPGVTREADALARDPYGADRVAAKAAKPLEFRHDVDAAITEAADKKLPCFIKFETSWCGPCKMMAQLVFTAKDVVEASEGVVCVMVDGDERKDLVERYEVKGYPTGLMIAADGSEVARFLGYQKVKEMTAFLKDKREKK